MKKLLPYFKGYRLAAFLAPLLKLCEALLELIVPMLVAGIIDKALPQGNLSAVLPYLLAMFALALINLIMADSSQYLSAKVAVGFTEAMTRDLYHHLVHLSQSSLRQVGEESLLARITSDTYQLQTGLNTFLRLFMRSPFIVIGALVMALQIDSTLASHLILMTLILFLIVILLMKLVNPLYDRIRQQFDYLVRLVQEQVTGLRVIRAFNKQDREIKVFDQESQRLKKQQIRTSLLANLTNPLTYLVVNLFLVLLLYQAGPRVNLGELSQGQVVALINYLLLILTELVKLTMVIANLSKSWVAGKRLVELLNLPLEGNDLLSIGQNLDSDILMTFDRVTFTYPGNSLASLIDIDLSLYRGEFLGLIGPTGSGKSTLLQLMTGSYLPDKGQVHFPLAGDTASKEAVRNQIAIVPSQAKIFKGSIRSNLMIGRVEASDDDLWQVLDDAQMKDFVSQLQDGLDGPVEEGGHNLSGGQRQRLSLARALLKPASLLILDDATSALDYLTEAKVQRALKNRYRDRTVLMISQRIRTIEGADRIIVMDQGKISGQGKHADLIVKNRTYRELYQSQILREGEG